MSTKLQNTIIRASAGTGKTYQLANRFIALLMLQAEAGKVAAARLVALTFTRKGAAEFASRILSRLALAAASLEECDQLQEDLDEVIQGNEAKGTRGLAPGVALKLDQAHIREVLAAVVDEMDRLCLGTIDSFMARSVQTLAFELGLGGFEILEAPAAEIARRELLGEVFRQAASTDLNAFYQTVKRATLRSSASLRKEVDQFARSYHGLVCAIKNVEAWGGSGFWKGTVPAIANSAWKEKARQLLDEVQNRSFGHKTLTKSLCSMLEWLFKRNVEVAVKDPAAWLKGDSKLCQIWASWPESDWSLEFSRKTCTIPGSIMGPLREILQDWLAAELTALTGKTQALYKIISSYEAVYEQHARRKGKLDFSDLPLLLRSEQDENTAQAIELLGFRWFQQFDHWLLDEFQDTSRAQWSILRPWLDEAIQDDSGTKTVFVVGDIKQSIYGWRGGEPRLFRKLAEHYGGAFNEQLMFESWRSRPSVLELVNRVCSHENRGLHEAEKFSPQALARWQYEKHECCDAKKKLPGYAAVLLATEVDAGDGEAHEAEPDNGEVVDEKLAPRAQIIKSVISKLDPLGKGLSCAILTRKGKNALAIAQLLRANGLPNVMVEGDATLADQSPLLATLLDALRWLEAPADKLAEGHVLLSPLWSILAKGVSGADAAEAQPGIIWRHWRERISEMGVTEVTRGWCAELSISHSSPYSQYCLQQVDQLAYRLGTKVSLAEWIVTLERFTVRETSAAGSIHVMTIHKAKGLGFDVVFLPDLDIGRHTADKVLLKRTAEGVLSGCVVQPPKWLSAWSPELGDLKAAQEADDDLEALCVLYVALTRAKEATFVVMSKERDGRTATRTRDWILDGVGGPGQAPAEASPKWGAGELLWETGTPDLKAVSERSTAAPAYEPGLKLQAPQPRRKRSTPSQAGHEGTKQKAPPPTVSVSAGQEFGTAVHTVFEQIEWWKHDQTLAGSKEAVLLVQKCLEVPELRSLFTPENPGDEACRELPIEFIEKDVWWSGVIDRVVLRHDPAGRLQKVELVDFKTDKIGSLQALQELYARQLELYRRALARVPGFEKVPIDVYLLSTHLQRRLLFAGPTA